MSCFERIEKTIPLDRIQDLAVSQGCIEKCFDIWNLKVETAGGGGPESSAELNLSGISNHVEFKQKVIELRDSYTEGNRSDGLGSQVNNGADNKQM
mmetsp:Transcript_9719/g.21388  ORF Transcript_9719/g.21388 Transcript_9719/m.21388 type:complete len:96 (-) Transcript_9719:234-521(-)|eukprot:CAMPEP_0116987066 /NCGR_PEP_ID=MMETSP0467-20121206/63280_1 /TAXON_ID=283647 /ORGANISM="Mesodinium pulex, Strain SPMC105" /LENGTH=95 /DNA_ID=CAMNT_0004682805 /DNA_START=3198 /DNA_END=3485 /DNA_ORIENTATION=-